MNDKELLELAAKAAGIEYTGEGYARAVLSGTHGHFENYPWNPLTDDADALRLAVKLSLLFDLPETYESVRALYYEELNNDLRPSEATCRAIVRAASEIGRGME